MHVCKVDTLNIRHISIKYVNVEIHIQMLHSDSEQQNGSCIDSSLIKDIQRSETYDTQ